MSINGQELARALEVSAPITTENVLEYFRKPPTLALGRIYRAMRDGVEALLKSCGIADDDGSIGRGLQQSLEEYANMTIRHDELNVSTTSWFTIEEVNRCLTHNVAREQLATMQSVPFDRLKSHVVDAIALDCLAGQVECRDALALALRPQVTQEQSKAMQDYDPEKDSEGTLFSQAVTIYLRLPVPPKAVKDAYEFFQIEDNPETRLEFMVALNENVQVIAPQKGT